MTYQDIKTWFGENKQKIVVVACFVLVFIIGFGAGRFEREYKRQNIIQSQANYTTKPEAKTIQEAGEGTGNKLEAEKVVTPADAKVLGAASDQACPVKGNASSKIYHIPGGTFYNTLKSPRCFKTETEAKAAGFRKSSR